MNLYTIKDVEILKTGVWKGTTYGNSDIDAIVDSFAIIGKELKPYLKLGHDDNQALLQKDGYPAAGWITNLRNKAGALVVDFVNMPEKIYKLVKQKAYGRFSSEIFNNIKINNKTYPKALKAVALLGGDTPEVTTLNDFINLYANENNFDIENIEIYAIDNNIYASIDVHENIEKRGGEMPIDEKYLETLEGKIILLSKDTSTQKEEIEKLTKTITSQKDEVTKLDTENKQLKMDIETAHTAVFTKEIDFYLDGKINEGKLLPAQKDSMRALAMNGSSIDRLSKDGTKTTLSSFDLMKEVVDNNPQFVEFDNKTKSVILDKGSKSFSAMTEEERGVLIDGKIDKYRKDHTDISYADAYDIVIETIDGGAK